MEKWKSRSDIERRFSPNNWGYVLSKSDEAYTADCPTLLTYEQIYGEGVSADWVYIQVLALYGSSANKDKGMADGIELFAQSFAATAKAFKLTELMLFFARYRAGRYDNSYSTFDVRRIGNAFFTEFLRERNTELERIHREQEQRQIEDRRFVPPDGYTSYSWYQELKRRAENGDKEAMRMISSED